MGGVRHVETVLSPYVWALASLPRIALVPLFILFLGFTVKMQITIIVLSAVFPIIINAWAGVKTTEKSLLSAAKVFGASRRELYVHVVLPYTLALHHRRHSAGHRARIDRRDHRRDLSVVRRALAI